MAAARCRHWARETVLQPLRQRIPRRRPEWPRVQAARQSSRHRAPQRGGTCSTECQAPYPSAHGPESECRRDSRSAPSRCANARLSDPARSDSRARPNPGKSPRKWPSTECGWCGSYSKALRSQNCRTGAQNSKLRKLIARCDQAPTAHIPELSSGGHISSVAPEVTVQPLSARKMALIRISEWARVGHLAN